jgi:hypothetical protein
VQLKVLKRVLKSLSLAKELMALWRHSVLILPLTSDLAIWFKLRTRTPAVLR